MSAAVITIERAAIDSPEARQLLAEVCAEIDRIYGNTEPTDPAFTGMNEPRTAFLIAREAGEPIGCAAIRPRSPAIAEVKRMYVRPAARGTGVGRLLMAQLEEIARENGFAEVWLETGRGQPAAMRLYESIGYARITSFGDYKDEPDNVCYGKRLN